MTSSDSVPVLLHKAYADEMRSHAVTLIWLGYQRLNTASLTASFEDKITGELVKEMKWVTMSHESPEWVDRYHVQEQIYQNVDGLQGNERPRVDIEMVRIGRGERPILGFEAKRLEQQNHNVGVYLGDDGLTAFLNGHYPTTHGEAGMLGFVQDQGIDIWAAKLQKRLSGVGGDYRIADGGAWKDVQYPDGAASQTCHGLTNGKSLLVTHVLLSFC